MATEGGETVLHRGSINSGRSSGSRRQNPQQQLSQIEKSVTHLLVATKQLLETLTQWSRGNATEGEVSDVYVRLGYEFNIACRAFNAINVDTQDLGPVPDLLRNILEDTLSQEASQASLDKYLPRIRDIIINLLQGLKKKQSRLRAKTAREVERTAGSDGRQGSIDANDAENQDGPSRQASIVSTQERQPGFAVQVPSRTTSKTDGRSSPHFDSQRQQVVERYSGQPNISSSESSMSSNTASNIPVIAPYPEIDTMPTEQPLPPAHIDGVSFPPPPPAPKQQDALLALQRGGDLERRASRRFSTYQIGKQLGGAANGMIPMMPPAQHSPLPNRGREVRESLQAVRSRGSQLYQRQRSERKLMGETSPPRPQAAKPSQETVIPPKAAVPGENLESPMIKTPEDKLGPSFRAPEETKDKVLDVATFEKASVPAIAEPTRSASAVERKPSRKQASSPEQYVPEESPQPGKALTLFLQYKSKVKKFVLDDGYNDLSIGRIQLAFIDKFAWNTHMNGVDLPDIYIQDSVSGVRYELEDLGDIKNNTVLVLNVEALDEVKKHIDDGLGDLRRAVDEIKTVLHDQNSALQRVNDRQQETAKDIASLAVAPAARASATIAGERESRASSRGEGRIGTGQLGEVQSLRRDLAVMRQTYSSFVSDINASMSAIRTKAAAVKSVAVKVALPDLAGETGRAYVNKSLDELSKDQEKVVEIVEEVQDSVEDLRKDVVSRGVRPLPRQLEQVAKDISDAMQEVKKMEARLTKEKPLWSKIWKAELQQVCDDRDLIAEAEALITDFKLDLENADKTFQLVEEATKQQNIVAGQGSSSNATNPITARNLSGNAKIAALNMDRVVDPRQAKDSMLGEVKGLKIDHEERLEAISRAERVRQKELESRSEGAFKKELGSFVEEGKLKKTGGYEEVERVRLQREEKAKKDFARNMEERRRLQAEKAAAAARGDPPPGEAPPAEAEAGVGNAL